MCFYGCYDGYVFYIGKLFGLGVVYVLSDGWYSCCWCYCVVCCWLVVMVCLLVFKKIVG